MIGDNNLDDWLSIQMIADAQHDDDEDDWLAQHDEPEDDWLAQHDDWGALDDRHAQHDEPLDDWRAQQDDWQVSHNDDRHVVATTQDVRQVVALPRHRCIVPNNTFKTHETGNYAR